jgi:hypothetical protein
MKTLTDLEREQLIHIYDPQKAHEYYLRRRHLKGRKHASPQEIASEKQGAVAVATSKHAKKTKTKVTGPRAEQRKKLAAAISNLQSKLTQLEALIRQKEQEANSANQKSQARKERKTKAKNAPKTAAEKAKVTRQNKQYRQQHQQKLKTQRQHRSKTSDGASGGGKGSAVSAAPPLSELKNLAVKVRGQIAVAKQKLAAL